ncbi:hypothetical protein [Emticicia fontis]
MKILFIGTILVLAAVGCAEKKASKDEKLKVLKTGQKTEKIFKPMADFPIIKDTAQFIAELRETFDLKVYESPIQTAREKITAFKKVKIYGSEKDFILIEYYWGAGATVEYPWAYQFILTTDGKLLKLLSKERYEFVKILPNQLPFLLTVTATARGNGGHQLYKVSADTLENVYEGYYAYKVKTYDAEEDSWVYEPNELKLKIKDFNKDGFNDISFHGNRVFIEGVTKEGRWFDVEIINGKTVRYSVDHPFRKIPVEFIFLYDNQTGHFKAKEDYSKKFELQN